MAFTVATVLAGLFAGFFVTYSASVVWGLARVDDVAYVTTFRAFNATVRNGVFAIFFFGCVPSFLWALVANRRGGRPIAILLGVGAALCTAVAVVTFAGSVPLNNELATYVEVTEASAAAACADFEPTWNVLNLLRAILATAGASAIAAVHFVTRRP